MNGPWNEWRLLPLLAYLVLALGIVRELGRGREGMSEKKKADVLQHGDQAFAACDTCGATIIIPSEDQYKYLSVHIDWHDKIERALAGE